MAGPTGVLYVAAAGTIIAYKGYGSAQRGKPGPRDAASRFSLREGHDDDSPDALELAGRRSDSDGDCGARPGQPDAGRATRRGAAAHPDPLADRVRHRLLLPAY